MTQIILVRHGQTPWNLDKIFRGSRDIPLNDQGREEARLAGEWLKGETIHAAYCLARCPGPGTPPTPLPGTTIWRSRTCRDSPICATAIGRACP